MKVQLDSALERVLQKINLKYHKKLLHLDGKASEAEFLIESYCALKEHHKLDPGRTPKQISERTLTYLKGGVRSFDVFDSTTSEFLPPFDQLYELAKYCQANLTTNTNIFRSVVTAYQYQQENQTVIDFLNRKLKFETAASATATPHRTAGTHVPDPNESTIYPPHSDSVSEDPDKTVQGDSLLPNKDIDSTEPAKTSDKDIDHSVKSPQKVISGTSELREPPLVRQLKKIQVVLTESAPNSVIGTMPAEIKVPSTWLQDYCDANARPGETAREMPNYTCVLVQANTSVDADQCFAIDDVGVQGSAVYVETQNLRAFNIGLRDVQTVWAQIASLYCQILGMSLNIRDSVDINTMSATDKQEYTIAYGLLNKLIAAKTELLTKAAVLNDHLFTESLTPFTQFVTFTTQKVQAMLPKWQRWINLRKGAGTFTQDVDGTLRLNDSINSTGMNNNTSVAFNATLNRKKLPEIQLKSFDGKTENFLRWAADWEAYFKKYNDAGVIDYYMMMSYLRQSMPDKPNYKKEMDTLSWDKVGYDNWMAELSRRHGSPVIQAMTYRKRMQTAPKPRDTLESFAEFRRYVMQCVNGLELSGIKVSDEINSESDQWLSYISPKLSPVMKQSWTIHKSIQTTHDPNAFKGKAIFRFFLEWMAQYETTLRMDHIETELMNSNPHTRRHEKENFQKKVKTHATKVSTRVTALGQKATKPKSQGNMKKGGQSHQKGDPSKVHGGCCFCNGNHFSGECKAPINKENAMKQVFARGLCTSCLHPGHKSLECRTARPCPLRTPEGGKCPQKHHTLLHGCRFVSRRSKGGKKGGKGKSPKRK